MNRRSVVLYIGAITYIEKHIETIVMLSNNFSKPKEYVQIGIDAEDYYKLKGINK